MSQKLAVVTGTARAHGIGRAIARSFVRAGYTVLGVDRANLQHTEPPDEGEGFGERYHHLVVDISSPEEVGFVPAELRKIHEEPRLAVLVNNAGVL